MLYTSRCIGGHIITHTHIHNISTRYAIMIIHCSYLKSRLVAHHNKKNCHAQVMHSVLPVIWLVYIHIYNTITQTEPHIRKYPPPIRPPSYSQMDIYWNQVRELLKQPNNTDANIFCWNKMHNSKQQSPPNKDMREGSWLAASTRCSIRCRLETRQLHQSDKCANCTDGLLVFYAEE